jgi:hypothetical protein
MDLYQFASLVELPFLLKFLLKPRIIAVDKPFKSLSYGNFDTYLTKHYHCLTFKKLSSKKLIYSVR